MVSYIARANSYIAPVINNGFPVTHDNSWRTITAVAVMLFLTGLGIVQVIKPNRFMNSYLRRGGELLTDWNRMGVQIAGAILAGASLWIIWDLLRQ